MTEDEARAAVYSRLHDYWNAAHPLVLVEYENQQTIDMSSATEPFIAVDIVYSNGEQLALGPIPGSRQSGGIWLSALQKESTGTAISNGYLNELRKLFEMKAFGGVNTKAAVPVPALANKGWYVRTLRVPFWFDDLTP